MSDIRLFRLAEGKAVSLDGEAPDLEKLLQNLIEKNLPELLGVRFLASEHPTGKTHSGRIDTLGLDENACPVILEYKRSTGETVITQGLFYLDWLMDHKADFTLLVQKRLGAKEADGIDWSAPRVICIAADFTRYDAHAVQRIPGSIELIRYRRFGQDLLLLELVNAVTQPGGDKQPTGKATKPGGDKPVAKAIKDLNPPLRAVFDSLEGYVMSLGDDVQRKDLKLYIAFKRLRNFATVDVGKGKLLVFLHLSPSTVEIQNGFTRDVSRIGHWGTGDVEVTLRSMADLDRAKPLLVRAYEG
jgi:predicted transport protein